MLENLNSVAVIGNYLPRICGIATFTTDLVEALSVTNPHAKCWAVAMNDVPEGYHYPQKVQFEINQNVIQEYILAASFLNINQADVVCLQHEYGIFGGTHGSYILHLLRDLRMPIVTTLHTVLKDSLDEQRDVLKKIIDLSERVVVMAELAIEFLVDIYKVDKEKITFIHHGIPDTPFIDPNYYKDLFGVEGRRLILTFGLLSPNKGIEYMIKALPKVVKKYPDVVYIVLGATHPHVKATYGEEYRINLIKLAKGLGVDGNIIFHNRFVELNELCEFLGSADIYVTPYLTESQIVSGTLAYAMGTGKAVISTPYWYANEMLADNRGIIVPFKDHKALAEQVLRLLDNDPLRHAMRKKAYNFCRSAAWNEVGRQYHKIFEEIKASRISHPRISFYASTLKREEFVLPQIRLDHMLRLTDDTGIIQHAIFSVPNWDHGYCTDDNARALIVALSAQDLLPDDKMLEQLQIRYLSFLYHAFNEKQERFRNFMYYNRAWPEEVGSDDSHGRAIWALGVNSALSRDHGCQALGTKLLHKSLKRMIEINSPRALAFAIIGIHAYLRKYSGDSEVRRMRKILSGRLYKQFEDNIEEEWPWFEETVTYANGSILHALLLTGQWTQNTEMIENAIRSLEWLLEIQTKDDHISLIGNNGWFTRGGSKAHFDQQPLEINSLIEACLEAYNITKDKKYHDALWQTFNWFIGQNDLGVSLYDYKTAGCRDGLQPDGENYNEGAESTLSWLQSLILMNYYTAGEDMLHRPD